MDVIVVGGSMTGLMHAIALKRLGHKVRVIEKKTPALLRNQAGGLRAGPEVQKFIDAYIRQPKPYAITLDVVDHLDHDGNVTSSRPATTPMHLSTWSALYRIFKKELLTEGAGPSATYETGQAVRTIAPDCEKVVVTYVDTQDSDGKLSTDRVDLVVGADGGHSIVRQSVLPGLSPTYAGYVTWRGCVPENILSEETVSVLRRRCIIFRTEPRGYVVCYNVPSDTGSVEPGETQFIWVWYDMLAEESEEFADTFTDRDGVRHFTTIPRGRMQDRIWVRRRDSGQAVLNPPLAELLRMTTEPFVTAIRDCASPNAVFHDSKVLLAGDALALFRPHVAMSSNQGAKQALELASALEGHSKLDQWETESLRYAQFTSRFAIVFGEYSFTGKSTPELRQFLRVIPPNNPDLSKSRI